MYDSILVWPLPKMWTESGGIHHPPSSSWSWRPGNRGYPLTVVLNCYSNGEKLLLWQPVHLQTVFVRGSLLAFQMLSPWGGIGSGKMNVYGLRSSMAMCVATNVRRLVVDLFIDMIIDGIRSLGSSSSAALARIRFGALPVKVGKRIVFGTFRYKGMSAHICYIHRVSGVCVCVCVCVFVCGVLYCCWVWW